MYQLIGQADSLFDEEDFETFEYIKNKHLKPMSVEYFSDNIDIKEFMEEEGWQPEEIQFQDPDVVFYNGKIGDKKILGINHSGIDQLFTENGQPIKKEDFQLVNIGKKLERDSLSWVLMPSNSVESIKRTGEEYESMSDNDIQIIKGFKGVRYQIIEENEAVAGLFVVNDTIDTIYTSIDKRRNNFSKKLIERALDDFPNLKHSDIQTELGKEYSKRSKLKMR